MSNDFEEERLKHYFERKFRAHNGGSAAAQQTRNARMERLRNENRRRTRNNNSNNSNNNNEHEHEHDLLIDPSHSQSFASSTTGAGTHHTNTTSSTYYMNSNNNDGIIHNHNNNHHHHKEATTTTLTKSSNNEQMSVGSTASSRSGSTTMIYDSGTNHQQHQHQQQQQYTMSSSGMTTRQRRSAKARQHRNSKNSSSMMLLQRQNTDDSNSIVSLNNYGVGVGVGVHTNDVDMLSGGEDDATAFQESDMDEDAQTRSSLREAVLGSSGMSLHDWQRTGTNRRRDRDRDRSLSKSSASKQSSAYHDDEEYGDGDVDGDYDDNYGSSNDLQMNGMQRARYKQEKEQLRRKEEMARRRGKGQEHAHAHSQQFTTTTTTTTTKLQTQARRQAPHDDAKNKQQNHHNNHYSHRSSNDNNDKNYMYGRNGTANNARGAGGGGGASSASASSRIDNPFLDPTSSSNRMKMKMAADGRNHNHGNHHQQQQQNPNGNKNNPDVNNNDNNGAQQQQQQATDYFQSIGNSPLAKTAAGVSALAFIGIAVGPLGLVVGAAAVGAGIGVMQLPPERRAEMSEKASQVLEQANEKANVINETVSTSCVQACEKTGLKEAAQNTIPDHYLCDSLKDQHGIGGMMGGSSRKDLDVSMAESELRLQSNNGDDATVTTDRNGKGALPGDDRHSMMMPRVNLGNRRVACFRRGRIVPVNQIHSLDPAVQPRAWLDVMASILTTRDEKNEAMEEVLILAKDKRHARMFLEEGILDSLMWILSGFFKKYSALFRMTDNNHPNSTTYGATEEKQDADGRSFGQKSAMHGADAYVHARLAANCCVTLGKAHCAIVHTEGDLLLMSAYNRGAVPIERQVAQMLFEVPHHTRVSTASMDPEDETGGAEGEQSSEFFALTELSMQESEHLAKLIKNLCDGKMDKQFGYNQQQDSSSLM
mmetsp:Transcript_1527/g.2443  ORF Transcript_1527/g.2443 Transcript_1527/m.2443 type:complete len:932 (+) Transcript_1527:172-2967(+)